MSSMKKRGTSMVLFYLGEIVAIVIVALLLISTSFRIADSKTPAKVYVANDLALVMDSLFSSPGNIIINYTEDLSNYTIEFNDDSILIYSIDKNLDNVERKFVGYKDYTMDLKFTKPKSIQFARIGGEIIVDEKMNKNINTLSCNKVIIDNTENLKDKKILVDPGYEKGKTKPSEEMCNIANSFIFKITNAWVNYPNILSTRNLHEYDEDEGILSINCNDPSKSDKPVDAGVVISLRAGKDNDIEKNNIKAFIVSGSEREKESKGLAFLIINSILENKDLDEVNITGVSIVPVDLETTDENFPKYIFLKNGEKAEDFNAADFDKIFVLLEIGNSKSEDGKELLKKITKLGDSISKGFMKYGK